jgi:hypothetical protein
VSKYRHSIVLLIFLGLNGCSAISWKHVDQADGRLVRTELYSIQVPAEWTYYTRNQQDVVLISRDGPRIQQIMSRVIEYGQPYILTSRSDDVLLRDMLPTDLAQFALAGRQSQLDLENLETVELVPASFAGQQGFRVEYRYRTTRGLGYRGVIYGAAREEGAHFILYEAPTIHFFERDLATFEGVVNSAASTD